MSTTKKTFTEFGTTAVSFRDYIKADHFYQELLARGYDKDDITVVMTDKTREMLPDGAKVGNPDSMADDAGKGALTGGAIGGIAGAILALGTSVVFPIAGYVIAGPLLGALAGGGAGGILGGIAGAIAHTGVKQEDADKFAEYVDDGQIVVLVDAKTADDVNYFNETSQKYDRSYYTSTYDA